VDADSMMSVRRRGREEEVGWGEESLGERRAR
jgi:hypothetical protein